MTTRRTTMGRTMIRTLRRSVVVLVGLIAALALVFGVVTPAEAGCYQCTKFPRHDVWKSPSGATECRLSGSPGNYTVWCRVTATNTLVRWRAGYDGYTAGSYRVSKATRNQRAWFRHAYRVRYGESFRMGADDPESWAPEIECSVSSTTGSQCTYAPFMNGPQAYLSIRSGQIRVCDWDRYRTPTQRCRRVA